MEPLWSRPGPFRAIPGRSETHPGPRTGKAKNIDKSMVFECFLLPRDSSREAPGASWTLLSRPWGFRRCPGSIRNRPRAVLEPSPDCAGSSRAVRMPSWADPGAIWDRKERQQAKPGGAVFGGCALRGGGRPLETIQIPTDSNEHSNTPVPCRHGGGSKNKKLPKKRWD